MKIGIMIRMICVILEYGVIIEIGAHSTFSGKLFESSFLSPFFKNIINIDWIIIIHGE